jgi:putative peptidoglycan lipid II flippase
MQFYIIIPAIIFWGFSSLLTGLLTIDGEFLFSSMGPIFIAIAMIVCVVFFKDELENIVLASGMLIGSLANFLFLLIVSLKRKILFIAKPDFISENVKVLFKQLPAKIASNLLTGANEVVDQYFAATLVVGSIAALNYGIKIPMFTIGIVTMALGNVLLPYFSKKVSENRKKAFDELRKILRFVIIGGSIIAILLMLVTSPLVSLIFERNAFTSSDTTIVSRIQQMYLLQIPAYIATILMVRFLESINKNSFMVLAAIVNLSLNILLNYLLIKSMGVFGLALATSIVAIVDGLVLYLYINHLNKLNV